MSAAHHENQPGRHERPSAARVRQFESAVELAARAHRGQADKAGRPYILHPLRIMQRCTSLAERTVALLYDVIEDTDVMRTSTGGCTHRPGCRCGRPGPDMWLESTSP